MNISSVQPPVQPPAEPPVPSPVQPPVVRMGQLSAASLLERGLAEVDRGWWESARAGWVPASWWSAPVLASVRELLLLAPGPALQERLAALPSGPCRGDHGPDGWDGEPAPGSRPGFLCACQVVIAAGWEACAGWVTAQAAAGLVAAVGAEPVVWPGPPGNARARVVDASREEVAPALGCSPRSAATRIGAARDLVAAGPLLDLLASGQLGTGGARAVLAETGGVTDEAVRSVIVADVAARVVTRYAGGARPWTASELRQVAKRAVARAGAEVVDKARRKALNDRRVWVCAQGHGMSVVSALIAETDAGRIMGRLTALAATIEDHPDPGPDSDFDSGPQPGGGRSGTRSIDQKRADLFVDTLLAARTDTAAPDAENGAQVSVVVTLDALLGLSNTPGLIPEVGPVPASEARTLAADGRWRAWITDAAASIGVRGGPQGQVVAVGAHTYTPSAALARLIRAREPFCRMPGCRTRSQRCDVDHTVPWPIGATTADNLGPLCRRHHNLKTHHGWHLEPDPDNAPDQVTPTGWRWRTPAGITYQGTAPPPLPT